MSDIFGHLMFNGFKRTLKCFIKGAEDLGHPDGLLHTLDCHDVGVNDGQLADPYGHKCKCPPGDYKVGVPESLDPPEAAYGRFFIPLEDTDPDRSFAAHGRDGIGIHGGGSDLPDPFAPHQGWEWTFGCLRLQNADLENVLVPYVNWIHAQGGTVLLSVVWDD